MEDNPSLEDVKTMMQDKATKDFFKSFCSFIDKRRKKNEKD